MKSKVTKVTPKKRAKRKPKASNDWQDRFIVALSEWPNVTAAAKRAQVSRVEVYRTCKESADFKKRFDGARALGWLAYEDKAVDREDSPALTIFMLKNNLGYSDRHVVETQTWQDKVIQALRERSITPNEVIQELGSDVATELIIAAGISASEIREDPTAGGSTDTAPA